MANYGTLRGVSILGSCPDGTKELNLIKQDGKPPLYDLRIWEETEDGRRTAKGGITLTVKEILKLYTALSYELGEAKKEG